MIVGRVRGNGDRRSNEGVIEQRNGEEEPINPRRPGIRGGGVRGNMIKGMTIMGRVINPEMGLKSGPKVKEERRGKGRGGRRGVRHVLNEVKVTTHKCIDIIRDRQKKRKEDLVKVEIT